MVMDRRGTRRYLAEPRDIIRSDLMAETNRIKQIEDGLGRIFRHMMPGLSAILAARLSHPTWFDHIDYGNKWHLLLLAAIATLAGNTLYVFHRYSLHQLMDLFLYWGRVNKKENEDGYLNWLATYIDKSFHFQAPDRPVKDHINLRSAQVIFMFLTCEIAFAFSFCAQDKSLFQLHNCLIRWTAGIGFVAALIQQMIGFIIDLRFVTEHGGKSDETVAPK
jgi:hypothetical protein